MAALDKREGEPGIKFEKMKMILRGTPKSWK